MINVFNSVNNYLKFSIEPEKDNSVPLLDTLVIRYQNNRIIMN